MTSYTRPGLACQRMIGLLLAGLILIMATTFVQAGSLPDYTGYTRVGYPPTDAKGEGKIIGAAVENKSLGITIYYMVIDRKDPKNKGIEGDLFGTGFKDFDSAFVPGKSSDYSRLDTDARYLYLYQVVNDSGREAAVTSVSIRLIIDPELITSWGHFATRAKTDKDQIKRIGYGFGLAEAEAQKNLIRPVSTETQAVTDRRYTSPAPAITSTKHERFVPIPIGNRPVAAGDDDAGREPETVMLLRDALFPDDAVSSRINTTTILEDTLRTDNTNRRRRPSDRNRWAAVRAIWTDDEPLKKRERSTIFGFTSDYPPTIEPVAVASRGLGVRLGAGEAGKGDGKIVPAVGEKQPAPGKKDGKPGVEGIRPAAGPADLAALALPLTSGNVPTPVPPSQTSPAAPAASTAGLAPPAFGGLGGQAGGGSGAAFTPPAVGAPFMAARGNAGGGGGFQGGFGGGNNGDPLQGEGQREDQGQGQRQNINIRNVINNNNNNTNNNNNNNGCCDPNGNVIPAPPAWLLGLLGLPVFAFLAQRRRSQLSPTPAETDTETSPSV